MIKSQTGVNMIVQQETRFNVGQRVFHKTPESDEGLLLEVRCNSDRLIEYLITFGPADLFWLYEEELSESKIFS